MNIKKQLFLFSIFLSNFLHGNVLYREVSVGELFKVEIDQELILPGDTFFINFIDETVIQNITHETQFLRDYTYRFIPLVVGRTRIAIDKVNPAGGDKDYIIVEILVKEEEKIEEVEEAPKEEEIETEKKEEEEEEESFPSGAFLTPTEMETIDIDQTKEGSGNTQVRPSDSSKKPGSSSLKKKSRKIKEFEEIMEYYDSSEYKIIQEPFISKAEEFIRKYPISIEAVDLQYSLLKAYKKMGNKEKSDNIIDELLSKDTSYLEEDEKKKINQYKVMTHLEVFLEKERSGKKQDAKEEINKILSLSDREDPIFPYLIFQKGLLEAGDEEYEQSFEKMKYLYEVLSEKGIDELSKEEKEFWKRFFGTDDLDILDKVLYELANMYEIYGKIRDVKKAYELYNELLYKYPDSPLVREARLKKFYFENNYIRPR